MGDHQLTLIEPFKNLRRFVRQQSEPDMARYNQVIVDDLDSRQLALREDCGSGYRNSASSLRVNRHSGKSSGRRILSTFKGDTGFAKLTKTVHAGQAPSARYQGCPGHLQDRCGLSAPAPIWEFARPEYLP